MMVTIVIANQRVNGNEWSIESIVEIATYLLSEPS